MNKVKDIVERVEFYKEMIRLSDAWYKTSLGNNAKYDAEHHLRDKELYEKELNNFLNLSAEVNFGDK